MTDFEDRYIICKIAKNRNGELGNIFMNFKTRLLRFREAEKVGSEVRELPLTEIDIF